MEEKKSTLPDNRSKEVVFNAGRVSLQGTLTVPRDSSAVIVFAHGSGSSRFSPRNKYVAQFLNEHGFATMLFDLMTPSEENSPSFGDRKFDIGFLAERLIAATAWLVLHEETRLHRVGYFGASTGAAAALLAATELPKIVGAVVSRGGRPDLAEVSLSKVDAPTLLIVGGDDAQVIGLNQQALASLKCTKQLAIVAHATHLFEQEGALESVALLACDWFQKYLSYEPQTQSSTAS